MIRISIRLLLCIAWILRMPRFFFDILDCRHGYSDQQGQIFVDARSAIKEAHAIACDLAAPFPDDPPTGWNGCTLIVVDEGGNEVVQISIEDTASGA
jgi:hypothetical protein